MVSFFSIKFGSLIALFYVNLPNIHTYMCSYNNDMKYTYVYHLNIQKKFSRNERI